MAGVSYLLDANVLSEPMRSRPDPRVARRLRERQNALATAAPVLHEVRFGLLRMPPSRRRREIQEYLASVLVTADVLPYDRNAAEWHAAERARLVALGLTPPYLDGQIAAIAVVNDLILVTRNGRDFEQFRDLRVEDWFA